MIETLAKNLKRYRQFKGLTQSELGKIVGLTKDTISKIEVGKQENIGLKYLELICKELNIGVEQLFLKEAQVKPIQIIISDKNAKAIIRIINQVMNVLREREEE